MFTIYEPRSTCNVAVFTCGSLWEYVDFVKDIEEFAVAEDNRNLLRSFPNMDGETPNRYEKFISHNLALSGDKYIVMFMDLSRLRKRELSMFSRLGGPTIPDGITVRMDMIGSTDYISCVFNRDSINKVYTRNDEKVSGRGKLHVKG